MLGQDLYYSTHQIFLSEESIYLLVFNSLNPTNKLEYWLQTIQVRAPNSVVFLVGTHADDRSLSSPKTVETMINKIKEKYFHVFKSIKSIHIVSCTTLTGKYYFKFF